MKIMTTLLLQRLKKFHLGCPKSLYVKLIRHESITLVSVAYSGVLRIKWVLSILDYIRAIRTSTAQIWWI